MPSSPARRPPMPPSPRPDTLLKTDEAAAYLRVSRTTLRELIRQGAVHPLKLGGRLRFDPRDLESVLTPPALEAQAFEYVDAEPLPTNVDHHVDAERAPRPRYSSPPVHHVEGMAAVVGAARINRELGVYDEPKALPRGRY